MIIDDGVTARLGADRFLMTTTTGGAAKRAGLAGGLAADRMAGPRRADCTSVTEQWATHRRRRAQVPRGGRRSWRRTASTSADAKRSRS